MGVTPLRAGLPRYQERSEQCGPEHCSGTFRTDLSVQLHAAFLKRHAVSLPLCTDRPQWYPLGPIFWPSFCILVSFGNGPAASLRFTTLSMLAALLCPVAAGTRCETCSCLRHLGGGFFSHTSPSDRARRYFFQVSFASHFIRGARCWASGCAEHIQGEIFYARTHPTRSPSSSHTYRRPFARASRSHSTRTCGQNGQTL